MSERRATRGAIFEVFEHRHHFTALLYRGSSVGGRLQARVRRAYTHSCGSLGPAPLINPTILCRAIGTVRAAAGHSQPAAACGDVATYRRWLYTKHPQLVQSLGPWGCVEGGIFIHSEIPSAVHTLSQQSMQEYMTRLFNSRVEQPSRPATCSLVLLD